MTKALLEIYPEVEYPPESAAEIVPHVTIGSRLTEEQQEEIKRELQPKLPIRGRVDRVVLTSATRRVDGGPGRRSHYSERAMTAVLFTCSGRRVDIVTAFGRAGATTVATESTRSRRRSTTPTITRSCRA